MANLVGRSEEWLRLIESGRRTIDSIEVLLRLADVLQVDNPTDLIELPTPRATGRTHARDDELHALHQVILDSPALRIYPDQQDSGRFDSAELAATLLRCQRGWTTSPQRYSFLARDLPSALRVSRAARWRSQTAETAEHLVEAYHLARRLLSACGNDTVAATVADRAMSTAAQSHQPLLVAASAWHMGNALLNLSCATESRDYVLTAAQQLAADIPDSTEEAALWGALHLMAAQGAAAARDLTETTILLEIARRTADAVGADLQVNGILFGPTEIGITSMEIALTLGNPDEVIRLASRVPPSESYPLGQRTKYHICQAKAFVHRHDDVASVHALAEAATLCPEQLRYDREVHYCLRYLLRHDNYLIRRDVAKLSELAELG